VGVALSQPDVGVAQDLLDNADVNAMLNQETCRGVAPVVKPSISDGSLTEESLPLFPVIAGIYGSSVRLREQQVFVCPC